MNLPGFTAESTLSGNDEHYSLHVSAEGDILFAHQPDDTLEPGGDRTGPGGDGVGGGDGGGGGGDGDGGGDGGGWGGGAPVTGGPFSSGVKGPMPGKFFPTASSKVKEKKCTPCYKGKQRCPNGIGNMILVPC